MKSTVAVLFFLGLVAVAMSVAVVAPAYSAFYGGYPYAYRTYAAAPVYSSYAYGYGYPHAYGGYYGYGAYPYAYGAYGYLKK